MRALSSSIRSSVTVGTLVLAACARPSVISALGPLITDRPDFTESAATVPKGFAQAELGATFSKENGVTNVATGELLVRAGLTSKVEFRVTVPSFVVEKASGASVQGLDDAGLSVKIGLHEGPEAPGSFEPTVAFLVGTSLPTGAMAFRSSQALPEVKLIAAWAFTDRFGFSSNANWGRVDDVGSTINAWAGSGSFSFSISDKVGSYAEYFAFGQSAAIWQRQSYVNAGLTYLVNNSCQFDVRAGMRTNATTDGLFVGLGLARRF